MKNYMKYFLLMGLVSVPSAALAYEDIRISGTYAEPSQPNYVPVSPPTRSHW
ncbi:MAG: hypothetical protein P8L77_04550 [Gammaproteobacteria bacterium]|nr:hypothetical protein [Gammaproteobacteria bacterium]